MSKRVLVVAAHADDESLGCAGTIARHIAEGDQVSVVFMTDGVSSRRDSTNDDQQLRQTSAHNAMSVLGVSDVRQFSFPDNQMDTVPLLSVAQAVEEILEDTTPQIIYTHFPNDLNVDHGITHRAVLTACRPQLTSSVKEIYLFEVLSSSEWGSKVLAPFLPQLVVDISPYWALKVQAIACYQEEMRTFPHSRSIECVEALAIFRGATHGLEKAEAFHIERVLV